jgi:hypothetical protein
LFFGGAELYVDAYVVAAGRALCEPVATSYRFFTTEWDWQGLLDDVAHAVACRTKNRGAG